MKKEPNHKKIYEDLIKYKFPDKYLQCSKILQKDQLSSLAIISLNKIIAKNEITDEAFNQRHRS